MQSKSISRNPKTTKTKKQKKQQQKQQQLKKTGMKKQTELLQGARGAGVRCHRDEAGILNNKNNKTKNNNKNNKKNNNNKNNKTTTTTTKTTTTSTEWEKVWSRLSAHLKPFFWLIAHF